MNKKAFFLTIIYILAIVSLRITNIEFDKPEDEINNINVYETVRAKTLSNTEKKIEEKSELDSIDNFAGNLYIGNNLISSIVQTNDNTYYLNHNIKKENSKFGAPFLDYRTKIGDKKIIIYGHNSKNIKLPFSAFENYYDKSYYENNKYIFLDTVEELKKYEIFSVYIETENFDYMDIDFPTKKGYFDHLNELKNKSFYETGTSLDSDEEVLIIQTCSTLEKYKDYERKYLIIVSRRVYE